MPKISFETLIKKGGNYLSGKGMDIPSEMVEDIVLETLTKLNSKNTFKELLRKDRRKALSYFYRSLYNRGVNYLKRENRELPLKAWAKTTFKDPLFYSIVVESEVLSYEIVDELLSDEKMKNDLYLVYLSFYKNLTLENLGWIFEISKSTVEYRMKNTIKRIDAILSSRGFVYVFQYKVFFRILFNRISLLDIEGSVSAVA